MRSRARSLIPVEWGATPVRRGQPTDSKHRPAKNWGKIRMIFPLWITGMTAIKQKHQYRYQSNTLRSRSVLSSIFMGMQIMRHDSREIQ